MARKSKRASAERSGAPTVSDAPEAMPPKPKKARKRAAKAKPPESLAPEAPPAPQPAPTAKPPESPLLEVLLSRTGEDMERLSLNLAEAMTRANTVFSTAFQAQSGGMANLNADPFDAGTALQKAWGQLAVQPDTLRDAHADLWRRYSEIWVANTSKWMGAVNDTVAPTRDKRFADPDWRENPYFNLMRETYLATSQWIVDLVDRAEGLDEATKRKAMFFVKQAVDAASPSNFAFTNPAVLKETLRSRGQNLLNGLDNLAADLARGKGMLAITQTDTNAFEIGKTIATAPGKVIHRGRLIELIQYSPTTEQVYETPLLIFPPWINKFYILDLQRKNSMIQWLVGQGITVFVASWVNPDARLAEATFETYMEEGIFEAVGAACNAADVDQVNTVGYCIGGTLLATALAYMARSHDHRIKSATFFAAQTDFELAGELKVFTDDAAIDYVASRMDQAGGFLESQVMADTFNALRSNDLVWNYVVDNYYLGKRPPPFDLLFWNADQTRMPRALHLFYLKRFYRDNALAKGEMELLGEKLNLGDVKIPIYMQAAKEDHIAPPASVYRSARLFGGPVEFMMSGSGHIAGVINHPDAKKYQHWVNPWLAPSFDAWRTEANERAGSWWPHWRSWLREYSGALIDARTPKESLGDAPGAYVKVKSAA
ncbi:MAG: class I poly(R)-hydroxyalkanoic acid synthase [Alphaproteobacteria bacterium]